MNKIITSAVPVRTWLILLLSIILTAFGQIFMKLSAVNLTNWGELQLQLHQPTLTSTEVDGLQYLALGVSSYFLSMLLWVYVLSFLKLSRAYPLLSLAYVLVYLGAIFWPGLNEQVSAEKNLGILIIMVGVFIVSLPSNAKIRRTTSQLT